MNHEAWCGRTKPHQCDNLSLIATTQANSIIQSRHNGSRLRFALAIREWNAESDGFVEHRFERRHMSRSPPIGTAFAPHTVAPPSNSQPVHANARSRFGPISAATPIVWLTRKQRSYTCMDVACRRLIRVRSRPLSPRYVTIPVRSVRYRARRGFVRVINFRGQNMKQLLLAGVALSVASAASAADMQARPY